jgi:hypothetical protein
MVTGNGVEPAPGPTSVPTVAPVTPTSIPKNVRLKLSQRNKVKNGRIELVVHLSNRTSGVAVPRINVTIVCGSRRKISKDVRTNRNGLSIKQIKGIAVGMTCRASTKFGNATVTSNRITLR